jgi:hypothetical protein
MARKALAQNEKTVHYKKGQLKEKTTSTGRGVWLVAVALTLALITSGCQLSMAQSGESDRQSTDEALNQAVPQFGEIERPFTVHALGGWVQAYPRIIHGVWEEHVLDE